MCGRTSFSLSREEVEALYSRVAAAEAAAVRERDATRTTNQRQQQLISDHGSYRLSPNVAPTSLLPVLSSSSRGTQQQQQQGAELSIETMKWGIATNNNTSSSPSSSSSSPPSPSSSPLLLINARSETAAALARFSRMLSVPSGRGVLAVDGYYEWEAKSKQPYFVRRSDGEPMLLAVLVDRKDQDEQRQQPRFVVLTRSPPKPLRWLHDRCPCILPSAEKAREWLLVGQEDAAAAATAASELLSRAGGVAVASSSEFGEGDNKQRGGSPLPLLTWHPVPKEVGKTSYQRGDANKDVRLGGIASLFGKAKAKKKEKEGEGGCSFAVKKEEEEKSAGSFSPSSCLPPPSSPPSGLKRKQRHGAVESQEQRERPAKKKKKKKKKATTTTATTSHSKGQQQRSLDSFLSPKKKGT